MCPWMLCFLIEAGSGCYWCLNEASWQLHDVPVWRLHRSQDSDEQRNACLTVEKQASVGMEMHADMHPIHSLSIVLTGDAHLRQQHLPASLREAVPEPWSDRTQQRCCKNSDRLAFKTPTFEHSLQTDRTTGNRLEPLELKARFQLLKTSAGC